MELSNRDFYFCYDKEIYQLLKAKGIRYIFKARSIKNNEIFTLYYKSDGLVEVLTELLGD